MRKCNWNLLVIFFVFILKLQAQSLEDVFTQKEMTWYGLDFSKAKFVGPFLNIGARDAKSPDVLKDIYFEGWNNVVINEKKKYNLAKFFYKDTVKYDLSKVKVINSQVSSDSMMSTTTTPVLSSEQLQEAVLRYANPDTSGLGLVFIIEAFDEDQDMGSLHAAFFDISTGKLLFSKRVKTAAGGSGLRNYWIRTVFDSMELLYERWKKWEREAGVY